MTAAKHTPGPWGVRPAWTKGRDGNPRRCGWHLMNGDEWAQTFPRKRDAMAEANQRNAAAAARFLMDHGVWHDRETGKHLFYEGEGPEASTVSEVWGALTAAGVERDGWRTLPEIITKLAAIAKATGASS